MSPLRLSLITLGICCPEVLAGALTAPAPEVKGARRFQFQPSPGNAWALEGSFGGTDWHHVAGPFFSDGQQIDHLTGNGPEMSFRLRYIDPGSVGLAPVSPAGRTLLLEHQGSTREVIFLDHQNGILKLDDSHARSFTAVWTKTGADHIEAVLSGADGSFTLLRLDFLCEGLGCWGMEDIPSPGAAASLSDLIDKGSFVIFPGRARSSTEQSRAPLDLLDRKVILNESGQVSVLAFSGQETVTLRRASSTLTGTYSYDPLNARSGQLLLNLPGMPASGLRLDMISPYTGTITGTGAAAGRLPTRSGTITIPDKPVVEPNPNCPPQGISGQSFIFADSSPCTITFFANGEGVQRKESGGLSRITHFRYLYSRTGSGKASVALSFPGATTDLVDDYELEFHDDCTGEYKRTSYAGGQSVDRRTSNFRPAPPGANP